MANNERTRAAAQAALSTDLEHTPYQHAKRDRLDALISVCLIFAATLFGFTAGVAFENASEPDCPTEDSCVVDYSDGRWHIKEVTP